MYTPTEKQKKSIDFNTHRKLQGQEPFTRLRAIADKFQELGEFLLTACPDSRELSLAVTNLGQAVMWANASILLSEGVVVEPTKLTIYDSVGQPITVEIAEAPE